MTPTRTYLVELYMPADSTDQVAATVALVRESADQLTREGTTVRYIRSIMVPEDETCFHVFAGASVAAVAEASRRASLDYDRIVETVEPP